MSTRKRPRKCRDGAEVLVAKTRGAYQRMDALLFGAEEMARANPCLWEARDAAAILVEMAREYGRDVRGYLDELAMAVKPQAELPEPPSPAVNIVPLKPPAA